EIREWYINRKMMCLGFPCSKPYIYLRYKKYLQTFAELLLRRTCGFVIIAYRSENCLTSIFCYPSHDRLLLRYSPEKRRYGLHTCTFKAITLGRRHALAWFYNSACAVPVNAVGG